MALTLSDPLAAVISLLHPQAILSKGVSGAGRWAVRYAPHVDPGFCLMVEGGCSLALDGIGVLELLEGDFVLLPSTPGFTLASDLSLPPTLITDPGDEPRRHGDPEGPATMRMLGGYFRFDGVNAPLLLRLLPKVVCIRRGEPGAASALRIAELIREETLTDRPGRDLILVRLVEVLLVEALRFRPSVGDDAVGLLAGLADPGLARALTGIHGRADQPWTLPQLAREAGMSRAVFAERFHATVGMPPMQYLTEWRMALARDLLRHERPPVAEVAERVGYGSASAFSTAFTRVTGVSPREFGRG